MTDRLDLRRRMRDLQGTRVSPNGVCERFRRRLVRRLAGVGYSANEESEPEMTETCYRGFTPMPGRVLIRPDTGPEHLGGVFLPDRARRFAGYRSGEVLATGRPTSEEPNVRLVRVGDTVHYNRDSPPPKQDQGVQLGGEQLVLLWACQILAREEEAPTEVAR